MVGQDGCRLALHRARQADPRHAFIESFNRRLRDELLNEEVFDDLVHARRLLALWRHDYNHVRPHSPLGGQTPVQARKDAEQAGEAETLASHPPTRYQAVGLPL